MLKSVGTGCYIEFIHGSLLLDGLAELKKIYIRTFESRHFSLVNTLMNEALSYEVSETEEV